MAHVVVMEDDAGTRVLIASVLKKDGHQVLAAEDGVQGLALLRAEVPDLVISDVQMPGLNGFDMLAEMRRDPRLAAVPVILLTSLQERAHMRIGMTTGADDYITKPFRAAELRQAVDAQLNKRAVQATLQAMAVDTAVTIALDEQRHELAKLYEERLAAELSERWPTAGAEGDERIAGATVLFADIPSYAQLAAQLPAAELAELVRKFYGNANDTVHLFGARMMCFVGEGLLAVFEPQSDTRTVSHTLRAMRAALGLVESARGVHAVLQSRHGAQGLPAFEASVAVHAGDVTITRLADPLHGTQSQLLPVGDAASATLQLQKQARALGWHVAASVEAVRGVTGAVRTGARALVPLPGHAAPLDAVEIVGLAA
ncbi:response regulator [Ramlibacter sp. PS4R-6]|uniref:response regulator n=1 Tax=Ramlibacter sp. PS4R-6 TaxID=3133438 RepID=UPI00309A6E07